LAHLLICFNELGELPESVRFSALDDCAGIEATLIAHNAKWHKSCRDNFNTTKLQRAEKRKAQNPISGCTNVLATQQNETSDKAQPFTRSAATNKSHELACFFCGETSEQSDLHEVATFEVDARVRNCAHILQDSELLAKLSSSDMIAIEAKYHARCLVRLYNRAKMQKRPPTMNQHLATL